MDQGKLLGAKVTKTIRRPSDLAQMGLAPIATIPNLRTRRQRKVVMFGRWMAALAVLAAIFLVAAVISRPLMLVGAGG